MTNIQAELPTRQGNVQEDQNPTTLRFSRRMGESLRGPDYADCFERPLPSRPASAVMFSLVVLLATVGAFIVAVLENAWLG